ncbi:hypothetical protein HY086_03635 [Candidatus Gottesmanbacteria bacterium]|nr:hypothetical protein [Candidatus Gottesmanbacteria bacterium]
MFKNLWQWYERHYRVNVVIATILFLLQAFHLYWMSTYVVALAIFGRSFFSFPAELSWLYALVDYTEIPALLFVSLIYIRQIKKGKQVAASWLYLLFLNSQWIHLFWITDEVIVGQLTGTIPVAIPRLLAYGAIAIDYLEIPVMIDTAKKALKTLT